MSQKWDAKEVLEKWVKRNLRKTHNNRTTFQKASIHFYKESEHIPISELEMAVFKAAKIVDELGPDYIDIFQRAEQELEKAKRDMRTMERIHRIAKQTKPSYLESDLIKP